MTDSIRVSHTGAWRPRWALLAIGMVLLAGNAGCWVSYVVTLGFGELGVLFGSRPIEDVLDDEDLDTDTALKLQYVLDVRSYAIDVLGLNGGDSYTTFYDSEGDDVLYNISACRKDRLEAYVWWFPIVGSMEYIGFFDEGQAQRYADSLERQGWDVFMYPPAGYSTIGWFTDPLFSAALDSYDAIGLTDLVIHEFTHNTAYKQGDSVFNESLATFVGHTGALHYLEQRFGEGNEFLQIAVERWADANLYADFWLALYQALQTLYSRTDLTSDEKIALREDVFAEYKQRFQDDYLPIFYVPGRYAGLPSVDIDNAYVMIQRRYNLDLALFQDVYDALGQDLVAAIRVFTASARADDPKQYLRDWLDAR